MEMYVEKVVDAIRNSRKPSGRTISRIRLSEQLISKYHCDIPLVVCYMIAKDIEQIPICKYCNTEKVSFYSIKKGFNLYCSVNCRLKDYNQKTNNIKSKNRAKKLYETREKDMFLAKEYYQDNDVRINDASEKYNIPYSTLRTFLSKNNLVKSNNSTMFRMKNFDELSDNRLFDSNFLQSCVDKGLTLKNVGEILGCSANTVRMYALRHNIKFCGESQAEREILEFMKKFDSSAEKTRKIISPYEIDIFSARHNLAIELNGEYWHSEDKVGINYHLMKQQLAESKNVKMMQIYLHEWNMKREIIESMIMTNMNLNTRMFARKLKFQEIDKKKARIFFDQNHLQGWLKCSYVYGLVDKDENIYSAISLGKSRYDKDCDFELLRFCNLLHHSVIGGFNKLMSNAQKILNFNSIISYSHRRLFTGKIYETYGFERIRQTRPGYFWYNKKNAKILQRHSTQKHKLNTNLTEKKHMENLGYIRVFDCGQNVYKYRVKI
jgi:DNA-binding transcriptional MerR regulator